MHEEWNEIFVVAFSVFKLQITFITNGGDVTGYVTVMVYFNVRGGELIFAGETGLWRRHELWSLRRLGDSWVG